VTKQTSREIIIIISSNAKNIDKENPVPITREQYLVVRLQEELLLEREDNILAEGRHLVICNYNFRKPNPNDDTPDDNDNDIYHLQQEQ
jgi:hypothetical protein